MNKSGMTTTATTRQRMRGAIGGLTDQNSAPTNARAKHQTDGAPLLGG